MSSNNIARLSRLIAIVALAAAVPLHAKDKPAVPQPAALHAQLTQISQDPASLSDALRRGERGASVCRHCHGAGGNSTLPEVPNLASQNAAYLLEQMNRFALGTRTSSEFMAGMIRALPPAERIDIALFLSLQPVVVGKQPPTAAHSAQGKLLYAKLCVGCHGAGGTGTRTIPRLAGQQVKYLEDALKRYRDGSGERIDATMASYTRNLKDADIQNLAAYLSVLQP